MTGPSTARTRFVTSFRMYEATPLVARAWRRLFAKVFDEAGVDVRVIEHAFPKPIDTLWREPGLCGAFMCGWPFARARGAVRAIAVPIPSPERYEELPRYCSEFLARESAGWNRIEESFGHRIGWMSPNSHSGFNAPRHFLSRYVSPEKRRLFSEAKGPYGNPARTLSALASGEVDVVAVDSFYLDLCRHHDPSRLAGIATIGQTEWAPMPPLVAAGGIDPYVVQQLRDALLSTGGRADYRPLLDEVLLGGFAEPQPDRYAVLEEMAQTAIARGYAEIL